MRNYFFKLMKIFYFRTKLTNCESDTDFYAKLYALRLGFSKLTENEAKQRWLVSEGRQMLANLMRKAEKVRHLFKLRAKFYIP